ncbi:MAG TPA: nucleotidyltransferase domain-containing protein [Longimicrobiaceae bacterium]|nr:nucleotidyltransferase domain-containing protein [Longimicrobiaceae bacterium]
MTRNDDGLDPRGAADDFASRLVEIFGDDLLTVVLYGSAARGDYRAGVSDINLLVLLRQLGLAELQRAASITRDWVARGNPPPLMLSEREWETSADAFPIEYTDIRGSHLVLHGPDPFAAVEIRRADLRLQLENELRSRKIQLRESYLAAGIAPDELGSLLCRSLPSFLTLFRAALRLSGTEAPADSRRLIEAVGSLAGFDPAPLLEVARCRNSEDGLSAPIDGPLAAGYLTAVERTVTWLDGWHPSADPAAAV